MEEQGAAIVLVFLLVFLLVSLSCVLSCFPSLFSSDYSKMAVVSISLFIICFLSL